jgi:prepilin-type N-terminal cleavage/methylation domain-containing protein
MNKLVKKEKGFTIIEVVLVLAIAGLIFMVVFLAVPGLQRGQRDTQRKQDLGRLVSTITSMQGNDKGNISETLTDYQPTSDTVQDSGGRVYTELIAGGSRFDDPSSHKAYKVTDVKSGDENEAFTTADAGEIIIGINVSCAESVPSKAAGAKPFTTGGSGGSASFAVAMNTEGGIYCQNG